MKTHSQAQTKDDIKIVQAFLFSPFRTKYRDLSAMIYFGSDVLEWIYGVSDNSTDTADSFCHSSMGGGGMVRKEKEEKAFAGLVTDANRPSASIPFISCNL